MPTASQRVLLEFFQHHLPFTPTGAQVDQFERDLALVSPDLMGAALKEAHAGKAIQQGSFAERRAAIFRIYYRKVAEHGQLFPLFHTFETAFRSTVAVKLETHYGKADWWKPIFQALRAGDDAKTVGWINGIAISKDKAHAIGQIIFHIEGEKLGRNVLGGVADGYAFAELCDLNHIGNLVYHHWGLFSPAYFQQPRVMALSEFRLKFKRVREARNDIYHHKSVANMTGVVGAAEDLLERLHCSAEFAYEKITASRISAPPFAAPQGGQHNLW